MHCPTRSEFATLAEHGNLIPVARRVLADYETPLSAYLKIRGSEESFLFESVEGGEHLGRYSFVGCAPRAVIVQHGDTVELREHGRRAAEWKVRGSGADEPGRVRDGLAAVADVLRRFHPVSVPGLPRFTGGAIGYLGYEFIHDVEPVVPRPVRDDLGTPVLYFLIADQLLVFDRVAQTLTVMVNAVIEPGADPGRAYDKAVTEIERLVSLLEQPSHHPAVTADPDAPPLAFTSNQPRERFLANVLKAKEYITAGDIIQVVGSQRFSARVRATPLEIYRAARTINPSPYMFLLELDGFALVGASPEIHVRCEDRRVEIRPIAGTRPRGRTAEEDVEQERDLLADPKERAEHVMLVDLARNDLGRVCEYGTVKVRDLMVIEKYSHVMHIVSQVEGRLAADKTPFDLMRATFPAGTLSGAPKIRAMQIISELEQTQRGPYGGCVGYFSFGGNLDCCITIRTALLKDGHAFVQAGGGWVSDSKPENELAETVNKSKAMFKALAMAESFTGQGSQAAPPAKASSRG
ncbi:MAG TPA: anthranilate synthase component I [Verrucomicrobiota bacterium]|nr:anthranilate synthase component I [Verrucomicrobiota bacterium]HRZ38107.1 anthranilate synthase component I [Candidatus Paceibacterota bacterium]HRZ56860.1 anthranilate synthase component I [Candidatus Paceibacterota bacterium]